MRTIHEGRQDGRQKWCFLGYSKTADAFPKSDEVT